METTKGFHFKAFLFPTIFLRFSLKTKIMTNQHSGSSLATHMWKFQRQTSLTCHTSLHTHDTHQRDMRPRQGDSYPLGTTLTSHVHSGVIQEPGNKVTRLLSCWATVSTRISTPLFINPDAEWLPNSSKTQTPSHQVSICPRARAGYRPPGQGTSPAPPFTNHRIQGKSLSCSETWSSQGVRV